MFSFTFTRIRAKLAINAKTAQDIFDGAKKLHALELPKDNESAIVKLKQIKELYDLAATRGLASAMTHSTEIQKQIDTLHQNKLHQEKEITTRIRRLSISIPSPISAKSLTILTPSPDASSSSPDTSTTTPDAKSNNTRPLTHKTPTSGDAKQAKNVFELFNLQKTTTTATICVKHSDSESNNVNDTWISESYIEYKATSSPLHQNAHCLLKPPVARVSGFGSPCGENNDNNESPSPSESQRQSSFISKAKVHNNHTSTSNVPKRPGSV